MPFSPQSKAGRRKRTLEKFYNSYDRTFVSDEFAGEFTDIYGNLCSGTITGASVLIAVMGVDCRTGRPEYSINDTDPYEDRIESTTYTDMFSATIDAELGALIIPNAELIADYRHTTGRCIAGKVIGYTIDLRDKEFPAMSVPQIVGEVEFVRFIKENFDRFNNPNNYRAQNIAYGYHRVSREYPRGDQGEPFKTVNKTPEQKEKENL